MTDIKGFFRSRKAHSRAKLRTVVEMRQARLSQLRARRLSPQEAAVARQEVQALSYVLQCAGVTPDQYAALLSSDTMTPSRGVVLPGDPLYSDTLEPAPSNSPIAPGDVVRSTHPNHRGRLYRVTTVGHGLWGVRLSRTTGRPIGTEQPLKFSMEKMCEVARSSRSTSHEAKCTN